MSIRKKRKKSCENDGKKKLSNMDFRLRMVQLLRISNNAYIFSDFRSITDEKKVKRILSLKNYSRGRKELYDELNVVKLEEIQRLFQACYESEIQTKDIMLKSIISRFFEEEPDIFKRDAEEKNLESISSQEFRELQSVVFNNTKFVTVDVISHIFTFLEYDSEFLNEVGRVCKGFYVTILCSWPSVKITKDNLFKISSLVLRNVRKITIHHEFLNDSLQEDELEYLLKSLSNLRIRTVHFSSSLIDIRRTLKFFEKYSKLYGSENNPFLNVTECGIVQQGDSHFDLETLSTMSGLEGKRADLKVVFPNLAFFRHPTSLDIIKGVELRKLALDRVPFCHYIPQKICSYLELPFLRVLQIDTSSLAYKAFKTALSEILPQLPNLEELEVTFIFKLSRLDFSFISENTSHTLESLSILSKEKLIDGSRDFKVERWTHVEENYERDVVLLVQDYDRYEVFVGLKRVEMFLHQNLSMKALQFFMFEQRKLEDLRITTLIREEDFLLKQSVLDPIFIAIPSSDINFIHLEFKIKELASHSIDSKDSLFVVEKSKKWRTLTLGIFYLRSFLLGQDKPPSEDVGVILQAEMFKKRVLPNLNSMLLGKEDHVSTIKIFTREFEKSLVVDWKALDEELVNRLQYFKHHQEGEEGEECSGETYYPGKLMVNQKIGDERFFIGWFDKGSAVGWSRKPYIKRRFVQQIYTK